MILNQWSNRFLCTIRQVTQIFCEIWLRCAVEAHWFLDSLWGALLCLIFHCSELWCHIYHNLERMAATGTTFTRRGDIAKFIMNSARQRKMSFMIFSQGTRNYVA